MNLYLISAPLGGYDTYDSAVVVAETAAEARSIHPSGDQKRWTSEMGDWVTDPADVTATLIGTTNFKRKRVILASFNAG